MKATASEGRGPVGERSGAGALKGLRQIVDQVIGMLQAH
jgi:hypothetical protein